MTKIQSLEDRIFRSVVINDDGCWLWQQHCTPKGYAQMGIGIKSEGTKRNDYVHRIMYRLFRGEIDPELTLDHLCRVRNCVNPDHLEEVTHGENISRGNPSWKQNAAKTHCKRGHEFTAENTYRKLNWAGSRSRSCRACELARHRNNRLTAAGVA